MEREIETQRAHQVGARWRSWLLVLPVMGAVGLGAFALSPSRAEARDDSEAGAMDGGEGAEHGFMARRMGHLLDKVNATPAQRNQIQSIWAGLRPQLRTVHQQRAGVRKQMVAALTEQTINAADVEKLRQQSVSLGDKASALLTQGFVASAGVLTPDQRKIAAQEIEQQHQHHGRGFGPPVR
jgi:Spy/CpxP family protein refolding chaperone